jgi:hypothetical protein
VVHACLPETLDRFYQEVGRGGRDGRSGVSVLIPAYQDKEIAKKLNHQKIITLELGRRRWHSMFTVDRRPLEGQHRYALRLNVSPSNEPEDLNKVGLRSVDWNDRILTVMARAGLIRILNRYSDSETGYPWAEVEIIRHDHDTDAAWEVIGSLREAIHNNNSKNFEGIIRYAGGETCPAPLLADIYTTKSFTAYERIVPICSGCPVCGASGCNAPCEAPSPAYPWGASFDINSDLAFRFDHNNLLVVTYPAGKLYSSRLQRELRETLQHLREHRFISLLVLGPADEELGEDALDIDARRPFFVSRGMGWLDACLLPPGPQIVFLMPGFRQETPLRPVGGGAQRLVFMPDTMRDPTRQDRLFLDTYSGNSLSFESLRLKVRI